MSVLVAGTPTAMLRIKPLVPKLKNPSSWIFLNAFHLQPPKAMKNFVFQELQHQLCVKTFPR
jgi:hypothetical protein